MLKAILFNDTSYEKHHGSQLVVRQILTLARAAGIEFVRCCPMRHDWRKDESLKAAIATVDLCIINGEGTFHDDARQAILLSELAPFCRERGVACFLINSVWQRNQKLLPLAREFTGIYLRDELSRQELERQGLAAQVVPDLTLSYPPQPYGGPRQCFVVNGSVFVERVIEGWQAVQALNDPSVRFVSIKALPVIQRGKGFPRFYRKSLLRYAKSRREILASRLRRFVPPLTSADVNALRWRHTAGSLDDFLEVLAGSAGVITGRFHCATMCLLTGTPVFAIASNTHKIESLLAEAGLEGRIFNSYAEALERRQSMAYSAAEQASLQRFIGDCHQRATAMFAAMVQQTQALRGR